ncbi:MAG TPA: alpha/beta hydrolase fold domain-containing protein, partial [Spirochaetales bacterium]|nr:alpha/beta hydrolase fold domain-containing protein [Spirochaetales bacterium]
RESDAVPILLYFHGGAFLEGVTKRHWLLIEKLAQVWGGAMVFPDYPLAPEHGCRDIQKFALALYHDVLERYSASRVVLMGDSAGGGLALSMALELRDRGERLPDALILYSPWLDLTMNNSQLAELEAVDAILSVQGLRAAAAYYAQGAPLDEYHISPLYGSFHNLCPTALFTGTDDLLYADAVRFKERFVQAERRAAARAERPCNEPVKCGTEQTYPDLFFYEYPGMFHDWMLVPLLPEASDVIKKTITFCAQRIEY